MVISSKDEQLANNYKAAIEMNMVLLRPPNYVPESRAIQAYMQRGKDEMTLTFMQFLKGRNWTIVPPR